MRARLSVLLATAVWASHCLAATIPTGTRLEIRLASSVSTSSATLKQPVNAVLISPILSDGKIVVAAGARLTGEVAEVRPAEAKQGDKPDVQAILGIRFHSLQDAGSPFKAGLSAKVLEVDNARESVDSEGRILGIAASKTGSARMDQGIGKLADRFPGLADILGTAKSAVVKETDPNISYDPGVEMDLELTKPLAWNAPAPPFTIRPVLPEADLVQMVNAQPMRTTAASPRRPSDLTNLLFIGSREDLEEAFRAAGWSTAAKLDRESKLETFRALVEMRGYKDAPVSTLLLDNSPPDDVFQKQNNTFAKRHHLRIWHRADKFNGKDVWVCASTHDIGIDFSAENRTFIHKVDPHTDVERAKVVSDLIYTGMVKGLSLVDRPDVPRDGKNATGDSFVTDGKMAVIEF